MIRGATNARRALLAAAAVVLAISLGGCNTAAFCGDRSLLGFLFCDPALVDEPNTPTTRVLALDPVTRYALTSAGVDQQLELRAFTEGANDPLYPAGYIAREEWDVDGDGRYERSYPYGGSGFFHAFTEKGEHRVRVRVTDHEGNTTTDDMTILVKVSQNSPRNRPRAVLRMSNRTPSVGDRVRLDASGSSDPDGRIVSYEWHLWNDTFVTTVPTLDYTFTEPRENNALLKVTDDDGLYDEATVPYRVGNEGEGAPLTSFEIEPNPAVAGDLVRFRSTSADPGGRIVRLEWDLDGDNVFETDTGETITTQRNYELPGTYNIRLRATDNDGNWSYGFERLVVQERSGGPCSPPECYGRPLVASFSPFAGAAGAKSSNRFFARLSVRGVSSRRARARGGRRSKTLRGVSARGTLRGSIVGSPGQAAPPTPKALAGFLRSKWRGKLNLAALARGRRHKASALVLVTPRRRSAGRICVRVKLDVRRGRPGRGSFRVLGGTRRASRLRAKGRFGFELRPKGAAVLAGTISTDSGRKRGLPRRCR